MVSRCGGKEKNQEKENSDDTCECGLFGFLSSPAPPQARLSAPHGYETVSPLLTPSPCAHPSGWHSLEWVFTAVEQETPRNSAFIGIFSPGVPSTFLNAGCPSEDRGGFQVKQRGDLPKPS